MHGPVGAGAPAALSVGASRGLVGSAGRRCELAMLRRALRVRRQYLHVPSP